MYECFHCGHRAVYWLADFDFSDYGLEGEGIVQECECGHCGASITYMIPCRKAEEKEIENGEEHG